MRNRLFKKERRKNQPAADKASSGLNLFVVMDAVLICIAGFFIILTYRELSTAPYQHSKEMAQAAVVLAEPTMSAPTNGDRDAILAWSKRSASQVERGVAGSEMVFYSEHDDFARASAPGDPFLTASWREFYDGRKTFVMEVVTGHDIARMRIATPLFERQFCNDCPASGAGAPTAEIAKPEVLIGIHDITIPINTDNLNSVNQLLYTIAMLAGALLCVLVIFIPMLNRHVQENVEISNLAKDLEKQASTDALTGLKNRRYFEQALGAYFQEFAEHGQSFGLLAIDLDHFKQINDTHGHDVGDLVLKELGQLLVTVSREHDVVARLGGEEFGVILPFAEVQQLEMIAERYRRVISQLRVETGNVVVCPTASIGVSYNSAKILSPEEMYKAADQNLYAAKRAGRNRVAA